MSSASLSSLSKDELSRLDAALSDEKFRNLLADYSRSISDPAVRKANEEALKHAEQQAGLTLNQTKKPSNASSVKKSSTTTVKVSSHDID
jgi:hypothetical protein